MRDFSPFPFNLSFSLFPCKACESRGNRHFSRRDLEVFFFAILTNSLFLAFFSFPLRALLSLLREMAGHSVFPYLCGHFGRIRHEPLCIHRGSLFPFFPLNQFPFFKQQLSPSTFSKGVFHGLGGRALFFFPEAYFFSPQRLISLLAPLFPPYLQVLPGLLQSFRIGPFLRFGSPRTSQV